MQFLATGKFSKTSTATNGATAATLSLYGTYGSGAIYTATSSDKTLTGTAGNDAFIYDLTLSGNNALRFSGFTTFDLGAGDDFVDFTTSAANAASPYATQATVWGGSGNDTIWGGGKATTVYGDIYSLDGPAGSPIQGGNDVIDMRGVASGTASTVYGDGLGVQNGRGGNDTITLGAGGGAVRGDSYYFATSANVTSYGGNDTITATAGTTYIYGEAQLVGTGASSTAICGGDVVYGGTGTDNIFGDASTLGGGGGTALTVGGNDILHGGAGNDKIYGDAYDTTAATGGVVKGGNDVIDGGTGDDSLWGDVRTINGTGSFTGGNDTFVFQPGSGHDTIYDFGNGTDTRTGTDKIDVSAYGIHSLAGLTITNNGSSAVTVAFDSGNNVVVKTYDNTALTLTASDFKFAA